MDFLDKLKYKIFLYNPYLYSFTILILNFYNLSKKNFRITFNKIENIEKDKIGLCIATGPSVIPYVSDLNMMSDDNRNKYCFLGLNQFENHFDFNVDYRVVCNDYLTVARNFKLFNSNSSSTLLYSDSADLTDKYVANKLLKIKYLSWDQRHFNNKECINKAKCCKQIETNRLTIQEELMNYTKSNVYYSNGSTVSIHMIAFSILLGCKIIYLFGLDLNYKLGYVTSNQKNNDSFEPHLKNILNDLEIIDNMAKNIGVKIYSTCNNSPINNIFEYVENPFINI